MASEKSRIGVGPAVPDGKSAVVAVSFADFDVEIPRLWPPMDVTGKVARHFAGAIAGRRKETYLR